MGDPGYVSSGRGWQVAREPQREHGELFPRERRTEKETWAKCHSRTAYLADTWAGEPCRSLERPALPMKMVLLKMGRRWQILRAGVAAEASQGHSHLPVWRNRMFLIQGLRERLKWETAREKDGGRKEGRKIRRGNWLGVCSSWLEQLRPSVPEVSQSPHFVRELLNEDKRRYSATGRAWAALQKQIRKTTKVKNRHAITLNHITWTWLRSRNLSFVKENTATPETQKQPGHIMNHSFNSCVLHQ